MEEHKKLLKMLDQLEGKVGQADPLVEGRLEDIKSLVLKRLLNMVVEKYGDTLLGKLKDWLSSL